MPEIKVSSPSLMNNHRESIVSAAVGEQITQGSGLITRAVVGTPNPCSLLSQREGSCCILAARVSHGAFAVEVAPGCKGATKFTLTCWCGLTMGVMEGQG